MERSLTQSKSQSLVKFEDPPVPVPVVTKLTDEEVEKAARQLGMDRFTIRGYRNMGALGAFLEQEGAVKVAVGKYMLNDNVREKAVEVIHNCLDNLGEEASPEVVSDLVRSLNMLLAASDRSAKEMIKAAKDGLAKHVEQKPKNALPPKGMQIVAREVHVHSGEKSPTSDSSEVSLVGDDSGGTS
jgi:hypothetical protein